MVDDGGNAEECGRAAEVLEVPEEEGEDEADGEPHEPRDKDDGAVRHGGKYLQHVHPLRNRPLLSRLAPRNERTRPLADARVGDVTDGVIRRRAQRYVHLLVGGRGGVLHVRVLNLAHRVVAALLIGVARLLEDELGGGDEGAGHEHREDGEADGVVALDALLVAARVVAEHVRVVERDADEEHGDGPAERAEHALSAVVLEVVA